MKDTIRLGLLSLVIVLLTSRLSPTLESRHRRKYCVHKRVWEHAYSCVCTYVMCMHMCVHIVHVHVHVTVCTPTMPCRLRYTEVSSFQGVALEEFTEYRGVFISGGG